MVARLAPGETVAEGVVKPRQFVQEAFAVAVIHGQLGDSKPLLCCPTGW
jgi:hypothetical protein